MVLPLLIRYIRSQVTSIKNQTINLANATNSAQNVVANPTVQMSKQDKILSKYKFASKASRNKVIADARKLPELFGVKYMWNNTWLEIPLSVKALTEDDAAIGKILRENTNNFPILEQLYYGVHTQSRNLGNDILQYLDKDELEKTRNFWKKHGKNYL